jgi:hypothetical protein
MDKVRTHLNGEPDKLLAVDLVRLSVQQAIEDKDLQS